MASSFYAYETDYPHPGWAEQDPEDWWKAFKISTIKLIRDSRVDPKRIAGISFSGQMMGCLPVDRAGSPLRKAIIWADQRSIEEARTLSEKVGEERVYLLTGHRISPTYSVEKIAWVRRNEPDVFRKTFKVLHAKDFLRFRLTGKMATDYSDASSMNLWDINQQGVVRGNLERAWIFRQRSFRKQKPPWKSPGKSFRRSPPNWASLPGSRWPSAEETARAGRWARGLSPKGMPTATSALPRGSPWRTPSRSMTPPGGPSIFTISIRKW